LSGRILAGFLVVLLIVAVPGAAEPTCVVQAKEILEKIELGQPVQYDNVIVRGDLDLSRLNLTRVPVKRKEYETKSLGLHDYGILVTSQIRIINSVVEGSVNLNGTILQDDTYFLGTKFEGPVFLISSRFNQEAHFSEAQFNQDAQFHGAQFNDSANFDSAQFNDSANFDSAQFNDYVAFNNAQFNKESGFFGTQFNEFAYFDGAQFNHTHFRGAQFNQYADFHGARFKEFTSFREVEFKQESHFEDANFLIELSFDNSQLSKEAFFQGAQINGTLSLYRTKYDTLKIRWSSIHDLAYDDTAYHLLIQNFNKLGFTDDASECQYSYRCKHRGELWRQHKFDRWLFDLLAWATYGYGLRPVRPLGWSALFILVGGLFFVLTGSVARSKEAPSGKMLRALRRREDKQEDAVSIWEAFLLSATFFTSGASSIISATPTEFVPVGPGRYVVVLLRLLGWIFFVIFLSSLTRTV
jgi:uncharacterized protein YjbI with pentapeptide repeats